MFAAHHKVDNLIATIDVNGQQIDGPTKEVMGLMPLREKFEARQWENSLPLPAHCKIPERYVR